MVAVVILRWVNGPSPGLVAVKFLVQGVSGILGVTGDKELPGVLGGQQEAVSNSLTLSDNLQVRGEGRRQSEDAVARLGHPELGQAAKEGARWVNPGLEDTEELVGQRGLGNLVADVERRQGRPALKDRPPAVGLTSGHQPSELGPVVDLVKGEFFHRGAGDNQGVEAGPPESIQR